MATQRTNIGIGPYSGVLVSGAVAGEGLGATGRVAVAGVVVGERTVPNGGVVLAGGVAVERTTSAHGSVAPAGGVAEERTGPTGRVVESGGVESERREPTGRVAVAAGVAGECREPTGRVPEAGHRQVPRIVAEEGVVLAEIVKEERAPFQNVARRRRRIVELHIASCHMQLRRRRCRPDAEVAVGILEYHRIDRDP